MWPATPTGPLVHADGALAEAASSRARESRGRSALGTAASVRPGSTWNMSSLAWAMVEANRGWAGDNERRTTSRPAVLEADARPADQVGTGVDQRAIRAPKLGGTICVQIFLLYSIRYKNKTGA